MTHEPGQHWVLLGTAPASEEVWGLRRIAFPCGYYMPALAYAEAGHALRAPADAGESWAMGGFAFEVGEGGKDIPLVEAQRQVAGYRPWLAVFHDYLLDELRAREHTVMVWDRGVSIFYGLWREACQSLGDLVSVEAFASIEREPVVLQVGGVVKSGNSAADYAHDAAAVIHFMSQFMTLSPGDVYVLGPLAAHRVKLDGAATLSFASGGVRHSVEVA